MKNRVLRWIVLAGLVICCIALGIVNMVQKCPSAFLKASAGQILSTLVVLVVSYLFVQSRTDNRQLTSALGKVIEKTENAFSEYVASISKIIEMQKVEPFNPENVEFARKRMLSQKKKVDSHVALLKGFRVSSGYKIAHEQLAAELAQYHELYEEFPVSNAEPITTEMEMKLLNKENVVTVKILSLYAEAHKQS